MMYIPLITFDRRLANSIGFVVKYLYCVPHKLNDAQLATRVEMLNEHILIIRSTEHEGWQCFVIYDKP
jgi:hypothetical protein